MREHRSDLGEWRSAHRAADPRLRAFVSGYFASTSRLPCPVRERLLPSAEVPLLLNFGAPHRALEDPATSAWASRDGAWVVGLQDRPQLSEAVGERDFMIVGFTPLGAHHFLRTPMHLVRRQAVDLAALDARLSAEVMGRVGVARGWAARFDAIETLIAERVAHAAQPDGFMSAWRRLEAADGRVPIGVLAAQADCSHRVLIDRFRSCAGATPKAVARLLRFNRAVRSVGALSRGRDCEDRGKPYIEARAVAVGPARPVAWADLAADCGYADQAHLIKEFRQFAGAPPGEFLRSVADVG